MFTKVPPSQLLLIGIALSAAVLQGCLAAAIPLVLGAHSTFKTVQTTTGDGEVQIGFDKESHTASEKAALAEIRSIAIMPLSADDTTLEVALAESLAASGKFNVITPAKLLMAQPEGLKTPNFNALTRDERAEVIRSLCEATKADGLIYATLTGSQMNTNYWSFSRPNQVYQIEMNIYSSIAGRIVVTDQMKAQISLGGDSNMTDRNEISRIIGTAMGERILSSIK